MREKFLLQVLAALIVGFVLLTLHAHKAYSTSINVPFFKTLQARPADRTRWCTTGILIRSRSAGFYAFMVLVIVGSSDAVNLTDGLDGLAIGLMIIASGAMTVLTYVEGNATLRRISRSGAARPARRS